MLTFWLLKNSHGQYYWHVKAANNEIIAQSETYTSKQNAVHAVNLIKAGAAAATFYDGTGEK